MKRKSLPVITFVILGGLLVLAQIQSCKHESITLEKKDTTSLSPNPSQTPGTTTGLDGATLYANNCASCHGALATSAKLGTTAAKIQNGISNVSGMKSLSILTSAQIQTIATALSTNSSPAPTPAPTSDGATLYANNCASCHGALAVSSKLGATQIRIQNGISTINDMKSLSSLTVAQIQAIATALASTPMPTDGASLYSINCASCHGTLANSKVGSSSISKIQKAIKEKSQMKYLSTLTLTQIQAIASSLANIKGDDE